MKSKALETRSPLDAVTCESGRAVYVEDTLGVPDMVRDLDTGRVGMVWGSQQTVAGGIYRIRHADGSTSYRLRSSIEKIGDRP